MPQHNYLTDNMLLFWPVAFIAIGIIYIGLRFLVSPLPAARDFGVPASEKAYPWTKGTRDIVSGLLIVGLLWLKASLLVMGAFILIAALIPVGDFLNVYANVKTRNIPALLIHGGTAVFMCILGILLLRG